MIDRQDFETGLILGLASPPIPHVVRIPTAYSYNGTVLPKLPEWDRETYPYAFIAQISSSYRLIASVYPVRKTTGLSPWWWYDGSTLQFAGDAVQFNCSDGLAWGNGEVVSINASDASKMVWADYDVIHNNSGEVYFAASEPTPVYDEVT